MSRQVTSKMLQDRFDVLARTEGIRAKVRTAAGVVSNIESMDDHGVLPAGLRVAHAIFGEDAPLSKIFDVELSRLGSLTTQVDLFFPQHSAAPDRSFRS